MSFFQKKLFPQLTFLVSLIAFLFMLVVLLLTLLNPRLIVTQDVSYEGPVLHLYIDTSASVYPYKEQMQNFLNDVAVWHGQLKPHFFAFTLESMRFQNNMDLEKLSQGWVKFPTLYSPVEENLVFTDREEYHAIVSDFLFRDGFTDLYSQNVKKSKATNLFYFHPGSGNTHTVNPAVFILNQDNRIYSDGSYPLRLLFYSGDPSQELHYRVYYQVPSKENRDSLSKYQVKTGRITTENHYYETAIELSLPILGISWINLVVEIQKKKSYSDQINLLPPRKNRIIQIVYFEINRDAFAVKNTLDRYRDYQVETLYLGRKGLSSDVKMIKSRLSVLAQNRDIFFLISPPSYFLDWLRKQQVPFVHIPSFNKVAKESSQWGRIAIGELDLSLPPMDFLGERALSEAKWQESITKLKGLPIDLKDGDVAFHQDKGESAFFLRGQEMYWGIRNLFFLNNNILQEGEESYWDVFLLQMMDFLFERIGNKKVEMSHNFFLGGKVNDSSLPHLIKIGKGYHISPVLSLAGIYPSSQNQPPYNYRIPFDEYFPPPTSTIHFSDKDEFFNWISDQKDKPIPQMEREIPFRELPLYGYLVVGMITLFLMLLVFKWYDSRKVFG